MASVVIPQPIYVVVNTVTLEIFNDKVRHDGVIEIPVNTGWKDIQSGSPVIPVTELVYINLDNPIPLMYSNSFVIVTDKGKTFTPILYGRNPTRVFLSAPRGVDLTSAHVEFTDAISQYDFGSLVFEITDRLKLSESVNDNYLLRREYALSQQTNDLEDRVSSLENAPSPSVGQAFVSTGARDKVTTIYYTEDGSTFETNLVGNTPAIDSVYSQAGNPGLFIPMTFVYEITGARYSGTGADFRFMLLSTQPGEDVWSIGDNGYFEVPGGTQESAKNIVGEIDVSFVVKDGATSYFDIGSNAKLVFEVDALTGLLSVSVDTVDVNPGGTYHTLLPFNDSELATNYTLSIDYLGKFLKDDFPSRPTPQIAYGAMNYTNNKPEWARAKYGYQGTIITNCLMYQGNLANGYYGATFEKGTLPSQYIFRKANNANVPHSTDTTHGGMPTSVVLGEYISYARGIVFPT